MKIPASWLAIAPALVALAGCTEGDKPYEPKPPYSGKTPNIPQPPTLENKKKMEGDAYTVWGAIHDLRSNVHSGDFDGKDISIVGYIIKINWSELCKDKLTHDVGETCVPECAIHKEGEADEAGCEAPIPTFWVADAKEEKDWKKNAIPVMGWASNYAVMYTVIDKSKTDEEFKLQDKFSGVDIPTPLPNVGAKIKVKGRFSFTATVGTQGASSNPRTGVLTWRGQDYIEPPPEATLLPGMKK